MNFLFLGLPSFRCHVSFRDGIFFFQVMIIVLGFMGRFSTWVIWIKLREFVERQSTTCSDFTPFLNRKEQDDKGI